jgi:hypothetical protein
LAPYIYKAGSATVISYLLPNSLGVLRVISILFLSM